MKYKVLALDLDGTLTNSKKEVTEKTKKAITKYQEMGGIVVLASGRPAFGIMPLARELEIDKFRGYILAFNGGQIIDCKTETTVFRRTIPGEWNKKILRFALENRVGILTYEDGFIITEHPENKYVQKEKMINKMQVKTVFSMEEYIDHPVTKFLMVGDGEYLEKVEQRALQSFGNVLSVCRSEPFFLEITPVGIDKANSLKWLLSYLGIDKYSMAVCGDGYNDQSMIEFAGLGIAMENGQPCVKAAADLTAPSNDKDGVAWVIYNKLLKNEASDAELCKKILTSNIMYSNITS